MLESWCHCASVAMYSERSPGIRHTGMCRRHGHSQRKKRSKQGDEPHAVSYNLTLRRPCSLIITYFSLHRLYHSRIGQEKPPPLSSRHPFFIGTDTAVTTSRNRRDMLVGVYAPFRLVEHMAILLRSRPCFLRSYKQGRPPRYVFAEASLGLDSTICIDTNQSPTDKRVAIDIDHEAR